MMEIIAGGVAGLLLGMAAQGLGLSDRRQVTASIALRSRGMLRATLYALGLGAVLTAFLGWLAVIDVDLLTVLPLHGGTILGAAVFGIAAGLTGVTIGGALTMTGGGSFPEGLCAAIGCLAGAAALPWLAPVTAWAQGWFPAMDQTWFRVTLDEPYLLDGGFLGQACLGAVLAALAVILGPERGTEPAPEPEVRDAQPVSTDAREVREDTVVATLPGEEPVVVDTAAPEERDAEPPEEERPTEGSDAQDSAKASGDTHGAREDRTENSADETDAEDSNKASGESHGARQDRAEHPANGSDAQDSDKASSDSHGARQDRAENPADEPDVQESAKASSDSHGAHQDRAEHPPDEPVAQDSAKASGDSHGARQDCAEHPPEQGNPPAGPDVASAAAGDAPPVMTDHPELDAPPEDAGDWTEQMARLEEGAGQGTPVQEEALPVGARAVGEPERREASEEDEHLG